MAVVRRKDIVGQRFDRLTVEIFEETRERQAYWNCRCECGNTLVVCGSRLRTGGTNSCGCLQKEAVSQSQQKYNQFVSNGTLMYARKSSLYNIRTCIRKKQSSGQLSRNSAKSGETIFRFFSIEV